MSIRVLRNNEFNSLFMRLVDSKLEYGPDYANRFIEAFEDKVTLIERFPSLGTLSTYLDQRGVAYRKIRVGDALLFYSYEATSETIRLGYIFNEREDYDSMLR